MVSLKALEEKNLATLLSFSFGNPWHVDASLLSLLLSLYDVVCVTQCLLLLMRTQIILG